MKIQRVQVDGFRSLVNLTWPSNETAHLGSMVALYGKNGTGKSNLLALLDLVLNSPGMGKYVANCEYEIRSQRVAFSRTLGWSDVTRAIIELTRSTFPLRQVLESFQAANRDGLSTAAHRAAAQMLESLLSPPTITVKVEAHLLENDRDGVLRVCFMGLSIMGTPWIIDGSLVSPSDGTKVGKQALMRGLIEQCIAGFFYLPCPRRILPSEKLRRPARDDLEPLEPSWWQTAQLSEIFAPDELANLFYWAQLDPSSATRLARFRRHVQRYLERIDVEFDYRSKTIRLVESSIPSERPSDSFLPASLKGTGIQQLIHIMAVRHLLDAPVVAIDELEANLAPEVQRFVWRELATAISDDKDPLGQVLVTSHSPTFLLDDVHDVDVYYVTIQPKESVTKVQRLVGDAEIKKSLHDHFGVLNRAVWRRLGAAHWSSEGADPFEVAEKRMFFGNEERAHSYELEILQSRVGDGSAVTFAAQVTTNVSGKQIGRLDVALALDEWLVGSRDKPPHRARVEWFSTTEIDGSELSRGVEVSRAGQNRGEVVLSVEIRIPSETLRNVGAEHCWMRADRILRDEVVRLSRRVQGEDDL